MNWAKTARLKKQVPHTLTRLWQLKTRARQSRLLKSEFATHLSISLAHHMQFCEFCWMTVVWHVEMMSEI